jgi:hypothetical protein
MKRTPHMPGDPGRVDASMANYIFSTSVLLRELYEDAQNPSSSHDFGRDILLGLVWPRPSTERKPSARWRTFQSAACGFRVNFLRDA